VCVAFADVQWATLGFTPNSLNDNADAKVGRDLQEVDDVSGLKLLNAVNAAVPGSPPYPEGAQSRGIVCVLCTRLLHVRLGVSLPRPASPPPPRRALCVISLVHTHIHLRCCHARCVSWRVPKVS
jgi:hypothetical protein